MDNTQRGVQKTYEPGYRRDYDGQDIERHIKAQRTRWFGSYEVKISGRDEQENNRMKPRENQTNRKTKDGSLEYEQDGKNMSKKRKVECDSN